MNGSLVSSVYSGDTGLVFTYTRDGYLVVIVCKAGKSQYILVYNNSYTLIYKTNFTISMSSADILGYSSKRIALAYKRYSEVKRILVIDVSSNKTLLDLCRNSSTKFFLIKSFKDIIQVVFGEIYSSRKTFYTINLSSGEIVSFALEPETTVGKIVGTGHNWVIVRYPYIVEVYTIDGESIAEISLSDIARDIDAGYDELYLYGINYRDGVLALLIELEKGIHSKYYLVLYGVDERQFIKAIPVEGIESVRNNYIEFIKDYIVVYSSSWYRVYVLPEYRLVYSGSGIKVLSLIGESLYMLQSGKIIILNVVKNTSRVVKLPSKVLSDKTVSGLLVKAVGKYYIVLEGEIYTHVVELTTGRVISIQTPGLEDPYEIYLDPEANWVAIYSIGLYIIGDIPLESMLESAWTETSTSTTTPGTSASIISPTQTSTPHTEKTTKTPTTHTPTTNTSPEIESTKPTNTTSSTSTSTSNVKNQEGLLVTTIILIVFLLAIIAVIKVLRK